MTTIIDQRTPHNMLTTDTVANVRNGLMHNSHLICFQVIYYDWCGIDDGFAISKFNLIGKMRNSSNVQCDERKQINLCTIGRM